jgi:transposase
MARGFIEADRDQLYLMPPSVKDWLPENDLAWFVVDAAERMDLAPFKAGLREDGAGRPAHAPEVMVPLLLYAYCLGERSSRVIERQCRMSVGFRVVAANLAPDHSTICRFRSEHRESLEGLFTDALSLCAAAGLVKVGLVALDGTKMKGNAALAANRTEESIREEVRRMLDEAEAVDAEEDAKYGKDRRGDELPEGLQRREDRKKRLAECQAQIEREKAERKAEQERKIAEREREEAETGKKKPGRKPKGPEEIQAKEPKANVTDPDSRILKTRTGYVQGYNAQAVATEEQIIVAAEVTQEANDVQQLHPMLAKAGEELAAAGVEMVMEKAVADAGYMSEENLAADDPEGPELFIAVTKDRKQRSNADDPPRGRTPDGLSHRARMKRKLLTVRGRATYRKRGQIIEPVFGQIKDARHADRFLLRRLVGARLEWKLLCLTHNLLKLFRSGAAAWARGMVQADVAA